MTEATKHPLQSQQEKLAQSDTNYQDQLDSRQPTGFVMPGKNAPHNPRWQQDPDPNSPYNIVTD